MERKPIGYVVATVKFPVYGGDNLDQSFDWFKYIEPGITPNGEIGTVQRTCKIVGSAKVELAKE